MRKYRQYVVWGFKNFYHTHSHIHEAFYRTLKYMGENALWLDQGDDLSRIDFSDTFFISNHDIATHLPVRPDCFYLIHGGSDNEECKAKFGQLKYASWNVFIDYQYAYDESFPPFGRRPVHRNGVIWIDEDFAFYPNDKHMDFRWATDLTPPEIEANKIGARLLNTDSRVINWVGTFWHVNEKEIAEFRRACNESGVDFRHYGAGQADGDGHLGQQKVVSITKNISLVRESYFGPAIVGSHHLTEGYVPCRIFKNISYGQFGVTNSSRVNTIFKSKLIYNPDPYKLFFEAKEQLASMKIEGLYALMDEVARKHTYVNRINSIFKAIEILEDK